MASIHDLMARNSLEKAEHSTVLCFLLNQTIRAQLMNKRYPVCDLLVTLLAVWEASTNAVVDTTLPLGGGILGDNSSLASL